MSVWNRVAIVGVGLIGGSIGLALVRRGLAGHVVGIGHRAATLATAQRLGAVQSTTEDLASGVAGADLVIVCTPVASIVERTLAAAKVCSAGTLITDAGSTKATIVREVEAKLHSGHGWPAGVRFLGSHPIAGDQRKGAEHARADLFEGRVAVLTPTTNTTAEDRQALGGFWTALGSRVVEMEPERHDSALAAISHLPHVAAAAVAAATAQDLVYLAAGGWIDTTRVAAGDPALWQQILLSNREHVLAAIDRMNEKLGGLRQAIDSRDAAGLERLLAEAKRIRDAVGS
jgi:prephenate dehydrogenase